MKNFALFFVVACLTATTAFAKKLPGAPDAFDFNSTRLGITLEEFKQLPFQGVAGDSSVKVLCSDEADVKSRKQANQYETVPGLIECECATDSGWPSQRLNSKGDVTKLVKYSFVADDHDQKLRLYEIYVLGPASATSAVIEELAARYGLPAKWQKLKAEGTSSDQPSAIQWVKRSNALYLESPSGDLDTLLLAYRDIRLVKIALSLKAAYLAKHP